MRYYIIWCTLKTAKFKEPAAMQMLYDSDSFVVVHLQADAQVSSKAQDAVEVVQHGSVVSAVGSSALRLARHGFEIVDKRSGKEVYLDGSWAELFQQQINAWQAKTPTQDEVEDALECYTQLAQNPVVLH
jgi:Protein of unknown function (DUF3567)